MTTDKKPGLYANIHAKQERIKKGSGEHMRQPGSAGAPSDHAFKAAAKTEKKASAKTAKTTAKKTAKKTSKKA